MFTGDEETVAINVAGTVAVEERNVALLASSEVVVGLLDPLGVTVTVEDISVALLALGIVLRVFIVPVSDREKGVVVTFAEVDTLKLLEGDEALEALLDVLVDTVKVKDTISVALLVGVVVLEGNSDQVFIEAIVELRFEETGDVVALLVGNEVFESPLNPLEDIVTVPVLLNVVLVLGVAVLVKVIARLLVAVGLDEVVDEIEAEGYSVDDAIFEALSVTVTVEEVVAVLL